MAPRDFLSQLGRALNGRRSGEADIWTNFTVVRPLDPRGLTVVKSECNEQEIVVGNVSGLTFAPGASVMIGTNTNRPGKAIIAGAPPGRMGASLVPQDYATRTYGSAPETGPPPPVCPVSLTGRTYIGFLNHISSSTVYAFLYNDGTYVSTIASKSYASSLTGIRAGRVMRSNSSAGDVVVFGAQDLSFNVCYVTWDLAANTFAIATTGLDTTGHGGPVLNGLDLYFSKYRSSPKGISLYKIAVGASGAVNLSTALQGSALLNSNLTVFSSSLSHSGGANFDVPGATLSGAEVVPYFTGGAWNVGSSRALLAGLASSGNRGGDNTGYPIGASRSLRLTYYLGASTPMQLGVLPAGPGTPEIGLFPADLQALAGLRSGTLSVSPSAAEFCAGVTATPSRFIRFLVDDTGYGLSACPLADFSLGTAPGGLLPDIMLCRDN